MRKTSNPNVKCPKCRSSDAVFIIYGYPTDELVKSAQKGEVALGGCCLDSDSPKYLCKACGHEFGKYS